MLGLGGDYKSQSMFKHSLTAVLNYVDGFSSLLSTNSWLQFSSLCTYPSQCANSHEHVHNFLQDAELTKLLNCSHHLSAGTEAILNGSFKSAPGISGLGRKHYLINMQPPMSLTSKWVCLLWSPYVYFVVPVITGGGVTMHC